MNDVCSAVKPEFSLVFIVLRLSFSGVSFTAAVCFSSLQLRGSSSLSAWLTGLYDLIAQVLRPFILCNKCATFLLTLRADIYFGVSVCVDAQKIVLKVHRECKRLCVMHKVLFLIPFLLIFSLFLSGTAEQPTLLTPAQEADYREALGPVPTPCSAQWSTPQGSGDL